MRNVPPTFASQYPKVKVIKGDFDSTEAIKEAAASAHVVVSKSSFSLGKLDH
jgi:hypothetical protein